MPNNPLQQTGHANIAQSSYEVFLRVSRLLSWVFGETDVDEVVAMDSSTKLAVRQRDRFMCQSCQKRTKGQVHHIIPRHRGGSDSLDNLLTLCGRCHMLVSPIPDLVLIEVLQIRPEDLATEKRRVADAVQRAAERIQHGKQTGVGPTMEIAQAVTILEALANGIDPSTKETLPKDNVCHQPDVIRALYAVLKQFRQRPEDRSEPSNVPVNAGKMWSASEEDRLRQEFAAHLTIAEIARRHGRTKIAILGRLMRLGLLRREFTAETRWELHANKAEDGQRNMAGHSALSEAGASEVPGHTVLPLPSRSVRVRKPNQVRFLAGKIAGVWVVVNLSKPGVYRHENAHVAQALRTLAAAIIESAVVIADHDMELPIDG